MSRIQKRNKYLIYFTGDDLVKVDTPDILSDSEPREFWVTFDDDFVRVGKGGEWVPFMEAQLPEHITVAHFGYSTGWGSAGWWQFHRMYQWNPLLVFQIVSKFILCEKGQRTTKKVFKSL